MSIGEEVRRRRKALGLTQRELGEAAGLRQPAVSQVESGRTRKPEPKTIAALAKGLKCTAADLSSKGSSRSDRELRRELREEAIVAKYAALCKLGERPDEEVMRVRAKAVKKLDDFLRTEARYARWPMLADLALYMCRDWASEEPAVLEAEGVELREEDDLPPWAATELMLAMAEQKTSSRAGSRTTGVRPRSRKRKTTRRRTSRGSPSSDDPDGESGPALGRRTRVGGA